MFTYVEMKCELNKNDFPAASFPDGISRHLFKEISLEEVYKCYIDSFSNGDARFFFLQSESERREYFDTLGIDEVISDPLSYVLLEDKKIIGFCIVLKREESTNRHISCMCITPEYQGHGIGKTMLNVIMNESSKLGVRTLTLGTEPEMKAYKLYKSNGFKVIAKHTVE